MCCAIKQSRRTIGLPIEDELIILSIELLSASWFMYEVINIIKCIISQRCHGICSNLNIQQSLKTY